MQLQEQLANYYTILNKKSLDWWNFPRFNFSGRKFDRFCVAHNDNNGHTVAWAISMHAVWGYSVATV